MVGSHVRHHPARASKGGGGARGEGQEEEAGEEGENGTTNGFSNGHGMVGNGVDPGAELPGDLELIPQDLLRKYIVFSKERVHPKLHHMDENKVASLYSNLREESKVRGGEGGKVLV